MKRTITKLFTARATPPGELGPKQLAWLRENVPSFGELEERTAAARYRSIEPRKGGSSKTETFSNGEAE